MTDLSFTFVTASHSKMILLSNLFRSEVVKKYPTRTQKHFKNISEAYNDIHSTGQDIVVYVHHDVFLPLSFEQDLIKSIEQLPDDWAVAGPAGVKLIDGKKHNYGYIMDRGKVWGSPLDRPVEVQTLDELLLITRGNLRFDENLPFDFYGADICMQAQAAGKKCYAINAFCEHNSGREFGGRTPEFYIAEAYFREKWIDQLPIVTTCSLMEKL